MAARAAAQKAIDDKESAKADKEFPKILAKLLKKPFSYQTTSNWVTVTRAKEFGLNVSRRYGGFCSSDAYWNISIPSP